MNQVIANRMVALREQGFSHREIAQKVGPSERTVRRYTKGISPQVEIPTQRKRVDVLVACSQLILAWRERLELNPEDMDVVFKELRKALERKDPLTQEWFATDRRARMGFLVEEFLPQVSAWHQYDAAHPADPGGIGSCGSQVIDEERSRGIWTTAIGMN